MTTSEALAVMQSYIEDHTDMVWWIGKVTPYVPTENVTRAIEAIRSSSVIDRSRNVIGM